MHRPLGGQFPYTAFFWPALAAASAVETASSAAQLLGFDADGDRAVQEPEGDAGTILAEDCALDERAPLREPSDGFDLHQRRG
jgi:hypothetical protein